MSISNCYVCVYMCVHVCAFQVDIEIRLGCLALRQQIPNLKKETLLNQMNQMPEICC